MRLHLVRHGETPWNAEARLQGQTMHVPLSERGREQARLVAEHIAALPVTHLWTSDLLRARQTAEIICQRLPQLQPHPTALLREQALGSMVGQLARDLEAQPVPEGQHISEICWAGGESLQQVHQRLCKLIDQLRATLPADAEVVLVSHGDAIRVLLAVLDGRSHREVEWVPVDNATILTRDLGTAPC